VRPPPKIPTDGTAALRQETGGNNETDFPQIAQN